ncbi:MAG: hypothetical protein WCD87_01525 [Pseudolabrys sp.]
MNLLEWRDPGLGNWIATVGTIPTQHLGPPTVSAFIVEFGRQIWIYWPTGIAEERPPRFLTSFGMDNPNAVGSHLRPIVSDVKSAK